MPSPLALCAFLLAASGPAGEESGEPSLLETQAAAARAAGGTDAEDASRASRARLAHWAPQLRGLTELKDDERSRLGEFRLAPLREQDVGVGHVWAVVLAWDFSQVVYARDESQLALTQAHLSRLRREAAERAAQLFLERHRARSLWLSAPPGPARVELCFAQLRLTAQLDALTNGLFRDAVSRDEAACASEETR